MAGPRVTDEELQREIDALTVLTEQFATTRDPDKVEELTRVTQAQAQRVQELADRMGAEHQEEWAEQVAAAQAAGGPDPMRGVVQVQLSPRQADRVEALTGERPESVLLPDPTGTLTKGMAAMNPTQVELWAVRDVIERRRQADAEAYAERIRSAAEARIEAIQAAAAPTAEPDEADDDVEER